MILRTAQLELRIAHMKHVGPSCASRKRERQRTRLWICVDWLFTSTMRWWPQNLILKASEYSFSWTLLYSGIGLRFTGSNENIFTPVCCLVSVDYISHGWGKKKKICELRSKPPQMICLLWLFVRIYIMHIKRVTIHFSINQKFI